MAERKKSAKDIAFEKERSKLRSEIRRLQYEINNKNSEISELKLVLSQKENSIAEKDDWIQRLLKYMDLSEEDLKKFIEKEKMECTVIKSISDIGKMFSRFSMI